MLVCVYNILLLCDTITDEIDGIQEALRNQSTLKKVKIDKPDMFCYDSDLQSKISNMAAAAAEEDSCLHDFFVVLAICNTVVVSKRAKGKKEQVTVASEECKAASYNMENLSDTVLSEIKELLGHTNINDIEYEAESPDEQALVEVLLSLLIH